MEINIDIFKTGDISAAIGKIEWRKQNFAQDCQTLCNRLADIGAAVARVTYEVASYAGNNDINVYTESSDDGCYIVANGTTVGFIEFGTGVAHPLGEFADQAGAPAHGTYGKGMGKRPSWTYIGNPGNSGQVIGNIDKGTLVRTDGNPPANAFPRAVKAIQENFAQVAREVFGE